MRILFFTQGQWAFGSIHYELSKYAHERGHIFDVYDWSQPATIEMFSHFIKIYDYIVTSAGAPEISLLLNDLRVPCEKLITVAHGEWDFNLLVQHNMINDVNKLAGFGVVSESLYSSALALHMSPRKPRILNVGITYHNLCDER